VKRSSLRRGVEASAFLEVCGTHTRAEEAKRLRDLSHDNEMCDRALKSPESRLGLNNYLDDNPQGRCAAEVRDLLARLNISGKQATGAVVSDLHGRSAVLNPPLATAPAVITSSVRPEWCRTQRSFNRAEVLVCSDPVLSRMDLQLQSAHDRVLAGLTGTNRKKFETNNDSWAASRDACNSNRACVLQSYTRRVEELDRM
jgi:hypothetical protein